jgi:VanZ family protein
LFLLYLAALTVGLLVSNPFTLAGSGQSRLREFYDAHLEPVGHFLGFLVLGLLASASRWPAGLAARIALLAVYALGTEAMQALVPERTPELKDVLQNLAGAAVGAALGWMAARMRRGKTAEARD